MPQAGQKAPGTLFLLKRGPGRLPPAPPPTVGATVQAFSLRLPDGDIGVVPLVPQGADEDTALCVSHGVAALCSHLRLSHRSTSCPSSTHFSSTPRLVQGKV